MECVNCSVHSIIKLFVCFIQIGTYFCAVLVILRVNKPISARLDREILGTNAGLWCVAV
jgi:hypothetical protein